VEAKEKARFLSRVNFLEPLSSKEIASLAQKIPDVSLQRGQIFYTPAHSARVVFLLLEGRMRVYRAVGAQQLTLDVVEAGTMFGEPGFTAWSQGAYAEALEHSWVALVGLDLLRSLVHDRPEVSLKIIELLSERLHLYGSRMVDIALKEVTARLAGLILSLVEGQESVAGEGRKVPTRYTHEQLGTMISANRVSVTRALSKLREAGAIEQRQRIIHVSDMEALKRAAGAERRANQNSE
jgi:CRP/FNR family transcriptional regulator